MLKNRVVLGLLLLAVTVLLAVPTVAQDMNVIADGLLNPRQVFFDADGNLYVAEAGLAGDLLTDGDEAYGATGQVTMIAPDGARDVIVKGLVSYREGNPLGSHAAQVHGESLWVALGETSDFAIPFSHALVELDLETGRIQTWVDLLAPELALDPDGNPNMESNATDFVVTDDGTVIIANAGCNCLMSWSPGGEVEIAAVWDHATDNPVPSTIDLGPDGDIYVGFLTGFPFPQEGSRIERWSGGELVETYTGLTAVTGLEVTGDGTIYAVEFGVFGEDFQWGPGRVVEVTADGVTPVMEGLTFPYGIAQSPDGTLVVTTGSIGGPDGQVIEVPVE